MQIISFEASKERGLKTYFTGTPCKRGHVCGRSVSNRRCLECAILNLKKWRSQNPERVRELARNYARQSRLNNPERYKRDAFKESQRRSKKKLANVTNERRREAFKVNGEKRRIENNAWRALNIEKARRIEKASRQKHRDGVNERRRKRQAAELQRVPLWADHAKIRAVYREALRITKATGISHHVDHIIPLQGKNVSGLHVENNLQILTATDNIRKNNRMPESEIASGKAFRHLLG